jgi:hypothetical protein
MTNLDLNYCVEAGLIVFGSKKEWSIRYFRSVKTLDEKVKAEDVFLKMALLANMDILYLIGLTKETQSNRLSIECAMRSFFEFDDSMLLYRFSNVDVAIRLDSGMDLMATRKLFNKNRRLACEAMKGFLFLAELRKHQKELNLNEILKSWVKSKTNSRI